MANWGIASTAPEIEKIKAEMADYLHGLNSCAEIDYSIYSQLFDFSLPLIQKAYELGKKEVQQQVQQGGVDKPFLRLGVVIRRFFCSKILGHKIDLGYTDRGYMVCKRCKMHEYYDANFDSPALFLILKRVKWWIIEKYKRSRSNELPF